MPILSINGTKVRPSKLPLIGEGGEGWVHDVGSILPGKVLKVLKTVRDFPGPDLKEERKLVKERLAILPKRLRAFPNFPARVIAPEGVISEGKGSIAALIYPKIEGSLPLTSFTERSWREEKGISLNRVCQVFKDMHTTLELLHEDGVIIGDFKPDNLLICHTAAFFIDVEGYGVGEFPPTGYTDEWVDPTVCQFQDNRYKLKEPLTQESDWFSYSAMLFQCLTGVGPYGGTVRKEGICEEEMRPFEGLSVLSKAVRVPRRLSFRFLPKDLMQYFLDTFSHKTREKFPIEFLSDAALLKR